jgi:hypothetical protein
VAGQVGENVDDGIDDRGVEHVGGRLVVPLCHTLAEVVLGHRRTLSSPVWLRERVRDLAHIRLEQDQVPVSMIAPRR